MKKKKGLKFIKNLLCKIFGHKECFVMEHRYRCSGVKARKHGYGFGGCMKRKNRGTIVSVGYEICSRCGKKLSEARRLY